MKRILFLCFAALNLSVAYSQLSSPYSLLDQDELASGFFWPMAQLSAYPPSGGDDLVLPRALQRQFLFSFEHSDFLGSTMAPLSAIDAIGKGIKLTDTSIPITLVDISYHDFAENALTDGLIQLIDELFYDFSGELSPYVEKNAFFGHIDLTNHTGGNYLFTLPETLYLSNQETPIENLQIDPDDGYGFRSFALGSVIEVEYELEMSDKIIRLKGTRNGEELNAALLLKSAGAASTFPDPQFPPWPVETPVFPWKFSTNFNGETISGNAYTLLSDDGEFDKPFIFVEGIDFGFNAQVLRNGDFGWFEFSSGNATGYSFLQNMPELLNALRASGYDIILLDFADGALEIEKNSALLQGLISLANEYKTGFEELKIAGASMGGQICRVALKQMENAGIPHCTSHYISLDSPHQGANLPLSMQAAIYYSSSFNAGAQDFLTSFLKRPATLQLLILQFNEPLSRHAEYMEFMNALGYPEFTRNIAIANGSGSGSLMNLNSGEELLNYECSIFGDDLFKMRILAAPGDAYHDLATATTNVLFEGDYSSIINCNDDILCLFGGIVSNGGYHAIINVSNEIPHIDNAPGGTRQSMKQLIDEINPELEIINNYAILNCDSHIDPWEYIASHSFIPTVSALGIETEEYYLDAEAYLLVYPDACPFDRWLTHSSNTEHSEITTEVLGLILDELEFSSPLTGPELTGVSGNDGNFNLASSINNVIPQLDLHDGGTLFINDNSPLEFAADPNAFSENPSHIYARTKGCGTFLTIGEGGSLIIGDDETDRTASLLLMTGTDVTISTGGSLIVNSESELILKSGSTLSLTGGAFELQTNSTLIIEEGATLIFSEESLFKMNEGSLLQLFGELHISANVVAEIRMIDGNNGLIECYNPGISIHGQESSNLTITGADWTTDLIMVKENGALRTSWELGNLWISGGKVRFEDHSELTSNAYIKATSIAFSAVTSNNLMWLSEGGLFRDCSFEDIELEGTLEVDILRFVDSKMIDTHFSIYGGGYRVFGSEFIESTLFSESLGLTAHVLESSFEGTSYNVAITDLSDVTLYIRDSSIENYNIGVVKDGGELRMKCTSISECDLAVKAEPYTEVNLSTDLGGGYNAFWGNDSHFFLTGVASFDLQNGRNRFGSAPYLLFEGSILGACDEDCHQKQNAAHNLWPNSIAPIASDFDLVMVDVECDFNSPLTPFDGCTLKLQDKNPLSAIYCGENDPIKPGKVDAIKNASESTLYPLIFTEHFDGIPILAALQQALGFMSYYGEVPDEHMACLLLDELIQADHDLSNHYVRRVKNAARKNLLIASTVLLERDLISFDAAYSTSYPGELDLARQSLNKITLSQIYLTDYQQQFANELDKSRFSHAIGRYQDALFTLNKSDECGLDYIEQTVANDRLLREHNYVERLTFAEAYYAQDTVFMLSTDLPLEPPPPWLPITTSFGVQIESPGFLIAPLCGEMIGKSNEHTGGRLHIRPNPAKEIVYLNSDNLIGHTIVRIFDLKGRCCLEREYHLEGREVYDVNIGSLAPGVYVIMADDGVHKGYERLVVR